MKLSSVVILLCALTLLACQKAVIEPEAKQDAYFVAFSTGGFFSISRFELIDQNGRLLELQTTHRDYRHWTGTRDSLEWDVADLRASLTITHTMLDSVGQDQLAELLELVPETGGVKPNPDISACCDVVSTAYYALVLKEDKQAYRLMHVGTAVEPFYGFLEEHESEEGKELLRELVKVFP
ncbi:MAG: hypothetical protein AAF804_01075 [Bacteroidota bacterium]